MLKCALWVPRNYFFLVTRWKSLRIFSKTFRISPVKLWEIVFFSDRFIVPEGIPISLSFTMLVSLVIRRYPMCFWTAGLSAISFFDTRTLAWAWGSFLSHSFSNDYCQRMKAGICEEGEGGEVPQLQSLGHCLRTFTSWSPSCLPKTYFHYYL